MKFEGLPSIWSRPDRFTERWTIALKHDVCLVSFNAWIRFLERDLGGRTAGRIGAVGVLLKKSYCRKDKAGSSKDPWRRCELSLDADFLAADTVVASGRSVLRGRRRI